MATKFSVTVKRTVVGDGERQELDRSLWIEGEAETGPEALVLADKLMADALAKLGGAVTALVVRERDGLEGELLMGKTGTSFPWRALASRDRCTRIYFGRKVAVRASKPQRQSAVEALLEVPAPAPALAPAPSPRPGPAGPAFSHNTLY